ncbi:ABC transporter ATP-binding protein [Candidatus Peregrinibacteria bacterium]|nr:ABC transporter ATP-binding protein [Candidatus Peregrinibacteria bacterium]
MLTLHDISKIYKSDHQSIHALKDISLEIHEGEFVALMGPSGSGKSTLLQIMGGLDRPTHGSVFFRNKNIGGMGDAELSRFRGSNMGFVFQDPLLLPHLTLEENVMLPIIFSGNSSYSGDSSDRVKKLLKEIGLENRSHHKPSELSGGQKQRACIARALTQNPSLVLADEPTGNLDTKTGAEILELFQKLHKGTSEKQHRVTFVIATHDEHIAKIAQRIIHIQDGKIMK